MTPEEKAAIAAECARSRAAQGLPPTIEDDTTLRTIAALFRSAREERAAAS